MKSKKNILLGIIAINLTLLTVIQLGIWPAKYQGWGVAGVKEDGEFYNWKYLINTQTGETWVMRAGEKNWRKRNDGPY